MKKLFFICVVASLFATSCKRKQACPAYGKADAPKVQKVNA
jgi:cbb3-type cytochrome oxidase subunit 3